MGANVKDLRVRIRSVDSTLHLTKAMSLVASSKIRRALSAMNISGQYRDSVEAVIHQLMNSGECAHSPYMNKREGERTKLIVIAGDRGLAGGYNNNVFRLVAELPSDKIVPIGKRAAERYHSEGYLSAERFSLRDCAALSAQLCREYRNGEFDRLCVVYTKYQNVLSQIPQALQLLPLEKPENTQNTPTVDVLFEPDSLTVLNAAVEEYLSGMIFGAVKESYACEVAARRTAMDSASKNAQEMIDSLNLEYNRVRQGAITQEITEIVAGAGGSET